MGLSKVCHGFWLCGGVAFGYVHGLVVLCNVGDEMIRETKICVHCGEPFEAVGPNVKRQFFCSKKCKNTHYKEERRRLKSQRPKKEPRISHIDENVKAARAAGLSYGNYVAKRGTFQ